ncbi:MAG: MFS transporter [Acidobacteria bacterium]|nr:MAG: MFS transporter [Acidobacteriota bacterium]
MNSEVHNLNTGRQSPSSRLFDSGAGPGGIPPTRAWPLCFLLFLATALSLLDRQVLSVLAPSITSEFGMSNTTYSRIVFAFVLSYTVMFGLGGRLMDLLGTKRGLALSLGIWSVASAAHSFATGAWSLATARFFLGVGEGACFPAATKGAVEWSRPERRAFAVGLANGGSAFGAVVAPPLCAWWAGAFGWRGAFVGTAVLGLIWLVAWQLAFRGLPAFEAKARRPRASFSALLARPEVRRLLLARFCFDPVFYFYMFWIPQYLARQRGLSLGEIGSLFWIPFFVLGVTNIAAGRASDMLVARGWPVRRARLAAMLAAALLTPASGLASAAGSAGLAIALMSVLMLAHGIWIANFVTLIGDTVKPEEVGTAVGMTGTAGGIAGMLSNLVVGPVIDHYSFTPVFVVSALVYPAAWLILASQKGSD